MVLALKTFVYLFLIFIVVLLIQVIAQPTFITTICGEGKNYTTNSTYKANLNHLLSTLLSNIDTADDSGFYNSTYGQNSDKVYAMGLCRGDLKPEACSSCLNYSINSITNGCPNQKEAIEWYAECMLRYSNRSIFGVLETDPTNWLWYEDSNVTSNVDDFKQVRMTLLGDLRNKAAAGDSHRKYATGNQIDPNLQNIYALLQCTPDLSQTQCTGCLDIVMGQIPLCCDRRQSAMVISPSCNLRFEFYLFYEPSSPIADTPPPLTSPPSPPPPSINNTKTTQARKKSNTSRTIIFVVVPTVVCVVLIISICACLKGRKAKKKFENSDEISWMESLQYDFATIEAATDYFSAENKLGEGGFGSVYKGNLANGQCIAVKRLSMTSQQGDLEFKNEVMLVAKLQHRNLVRLLGFCLEGSERLLVYEFVPNGSLNQFIFDPTKREQLDWSIRYKIIRGIARGLIYLHEDSRLKIIHRDLKTGNILLDEEMNPKIADFGIAKLFVADQTQERTKRIMGTYGYMAPEYAMNGQFSVKSDVYSFGVLLLEIVTGQKISSFHDKSDNSQNLLRYAWINWREGSTLNIVDPTLKEGSRSEILRCIDIALLCVQENPADRPTMNSIVVMLTSYYSITLPVPSQPAFFLHSSMKSDMSLASHHNSQVAESNVSKSDSVEASINEASNTNPYPR